jgi:hypothetical protein
MTRGVALAILLGTVIALGFLWHDLSLGHCTQDDSFITFRYAEHLVEGSGLVFNPGWERVEGYTNFLWTVILAGFIAAGFDPVPVSWALGVLCGFGIMIAIQRFSARHCRRTGWESMLCLSFLAASSAFAGEAVQGLETLFFVLLVLCGTHALLAAREGIRAGWIASACLYALAAMTRPEGVLVAGLGFWFLFGAGVADATGRSGASRWRPAAIRAVAWGGGFSLLFGPYLLWRRWYYGFWVPNTFYAKTGGGPAQWMRGLDYSLDFALGVLPLLLLAVVYLSSESRQKKRWSVFPILLISVYTVYVVAVGGDFKSTFRFFMPVFPFLVLLAQEGMFLLRDRIGWNPVRLGALVLVAVLAFTKVFPWLREIRYSSDYALIALPPLILVVTFGLAGALDRKPWAAIPIVLIPAWTVYLLVNGGDFEPTYRVLMPMYPFLILAGVEGLLRLGGRFRRVPARAVAIVGLAVLCCAHLFAFSMGGRYYARALRESLINKRMMADFLRESTGGDDILAIGTVGIVPYYSRLPTIDMWGLNDLHIAHRDSPWAGRGSAGHEKGDGRYVFDRRPTILVFRAIAQTSTPFPIERLGEYWTELFLSERELLMIPEFLDRYELRSEYLVGFYFNYFRLRDSGDA